MFYENDLERNDEDTQTIELLKQYDKTRVELRNLERKLKIACTDYGRRRGLWMYRPDHLRIALQMQEETQAA
jgi:hypothetical protein